ncbi:MAG: histidine--tRNA ligase [Cycloclasticus sp.]|nr:histidine--tRNA ligase [Cycloclasticus sp.]MBG96350.1 histidine--tRNA ligase [Cycloclasticus sp.]|tara:strand:+ start:1688 stop:2953 length:1266 start_codon:yes stop_codon:yes gene_type:complete
MSKKLQAIRGMHDILPDKTPLWQRLEKAMAAVCHQYGYAEIRMPIVESTDLFCRSIGEVTDIVEKEMYTFEDRNGDSLSLRPEGTASCVRAGLEHGLFYNQVQRLWYQGPMFRHERPQKGRYRQFHQMGIECFGLSGAEIEAEVILMSYRLWKKLGLAEELTLEINTLGTSEERAAYKHVLVDYFEQHVEQLDEDSTRRLTSNPLRILDSKNLALQGLIEGAPRMMDSLGEDSTRHFSTLQGYLKEAGIHFVHNPRLVRGLDYYSHTVFEWTTKSLGAQGTVCAGGRYDGLIDQLGGKQTPAVGLAMGVERLVLLLEQLEQTAITPLAYIVYQGEQASKQALKLAERLRNELPEQSIILHCGGGSLKSQFKKADKAGASIALILGEQEIENEAVSIKFLRERSEQTLVPQSELEKFLRNYS